MKRMDSSKPYKIENSRVYTPYFARVKENQTKQQLRALASRLIFAYCRLLLRLAGLGKLIS